MYASSSQAQKSSVMIAASPSHQNNFRGASPSQQFMSPQNYSYQSATQFPQINNLNYPQLLQQKHSSTNDLDHEILSLKSQKPSQKAIGLSQNRYESQGSLGSNKQGGDSKVALAKNNQNYPNSNQSNAQLPPISPLQSQKSLKQMNSFGQQNKIQQNSVSGEINNQVAPAAMIPVLPLAQTNSQKLMLVPGPNGQMYLVSPMTTIAPPQLMEQEFNSRNIKPYQLGGAASSSFVIAPPQPQGIVLSNSNNNLLPLLPSRLNKKKPHLIKKNELANLQSYDYYFQAFNNNAYYNEHPAVHSNRSQCSVHCCCCHHHGEGSGGATPSRRIKNKYENTMLLHNNPENLNMKTRSTSYIEKPLGMNRPDIEQMQTQEVGDIQFKSSYRGAPGNNNSFAQVSQGRIQKYEPSQYEEFFRWKRRQEEEDAKLKPQAMSVNRQPNQLIVNVPYATYGRGLILDLKQNPLNTNIPTKTTLTEDGFQIQIDIPNKYGVVEEEPKPVVKQPSLKKQLSTQSVTSPKMPKGFNFDKVFASMFQSKINQPPQQQELQPIQEVSSGTVSAQQTQEFNKQSLGQQLAELKRKKKEAEEAEKQKAAASSDNNPELKGLSFGQQLKLLKQQKMEQEALKASVVSDQKLNHTTSSSKTEPAPQTLTLGQQLALAKKQKQEEEAKKKEAESQGTPKLSFGQQLQLLKKQKAEAEAKAKAEQENTSKLSFGQQLALLKKQKAEAEAKAASGY